LNIAIKCRSRINSRHNKTVYTDDDVITAAYTDDIRTLVNTFYIRMKSRGIHSSVVMLSGS